MSETEGEFWLFAYGSLIWKPPPHFDKRVLGYVKGYVRRFWQASEDHRGTPEKPGRVVTLITQDFWETLTDHHPPTQTVWGVAYRIPPYHIAEVTRLLDIREVNGYTTDYTLFHPVDPSYSSSSSAIVATPIKALVYIGTPQNPQFITPPPDAQALAERIAECEGPSGKNWEYLFKLVLGLRDICPEGEWDEHVEDLWRRVERLVDEREVERARGELEVEAKALEVVKEKRENEEDEIGRFDKG